MIFSLWVMTVMGIGYQTVFLKQKCLDFCCFVSVMILFCFLGSVNEKYYRNHENKFPRFLLKLIFPCQWEDSILKKHNQTIFHHENASLHSFRKIT